MPRISAEARSAAAFRAGALRPKPPARLSAAAKRLWREIVDDRPVDFFRPGSLSQLEQYCAFTTELRRVTKALKTASPEDCRKTLRSAKDLAAMLATLARQLRITVQADVDRRAVGKLNE